MTVKEFVKTNGYYHVEIVIYDTDRDKYIYFKSYGAINPVYRNRIVGYHWFDWRSTLWIELAPSVLKPVCVKGYRFIALAGQHDREKIVEVLEWEADHLTRDALRNCMLSLYSHASIGDWTVHGYLERIENGWYHSTVCSMSAVTLMSIWPDKVASTEIRVNDRFIRRMGGSYAGQRTN